MHNRQHEDGIALKVLDRIERERVTPRAKEYFTVRNLLVWLLALVALGLGALMVAGIIYRTSNVPNVLPPGADKLALGEWLPFLPVVWLVALGLFGYLAYREIRHTRGGYRYELSTVLLGLLLASGVLGLLLYAMGSGYVMDRATARVVPFHRDLETIQRETWLRPQSGRLVGQVAEVTAEGFTLTVPTGEEWTVRMSEANAKEAFDIEPGARVGVRGTVTDAGVNVFSACEIRILEIRGRGIGAPSARPIPPVPGERNTTPLRSNECERISPLDTSN